MHEHQIEKRLMKDGRCVGKIFATAERLEKLCRLGACPADGADCPLGRRGGDCAGVSAQDWTDACSGERSRG